MFTAVVLVGGLGTRLQPLTFTTPKPLLPVLNKTFLECFLLNLQKEGVGKCILCLGNQYKKFVKLIKEVEQKQDIKLKLIVSLEKELLGTGGAIKNAEKHITEDDFFVLNGDIVFDFSLKKLFNFHKEKKAKVTISLIKVDDITGYGLVIKDNNNKINSFIEKPSAEEGISNLINAGVYIFNKEVLSLIPEKQNYSLERVLFPLLVRNKENIFGKEVIGYWLDIGTPAKFFKLYEDILNNKIKNIVPNVKAKKKCYINKNSKVSELINNKGVLYIGENAEVKSGCKFEGVVFIGTNTRIEKNCFLKNVIIFKNNLIKENSVLQNTIIAENCMLGKNAKILENVILGANSRIPKGVISWK